MKRIIELPWTIGDICWSILRRSISDSTNCTTCGQFSQNMSTLVEVRECQISSVHLELSIDNSIQIYYTVMFDVGDVNFKCERFTHYDSVMDVYATPEEAKLAMANEST